MSALAGVRYDPATSVHATALVVGEAGLLLRGPSGSGKSCLALALLALADDRGSFARLIGDDRVSIRSESGRILAIGAPNMAGLIERRGYGLASARAEPCAIIRLVVDLLPENEMSERLPDEGALIAVVNGVALRRLVFDARTAPFEQAYAVLGYLEHNDDKNMA